MRGEPVGGVEVDQGDGGVGERHVGRGRHRDPWLHHRSDHAGQPRVVGGIGDRQRLPEDRKSTRLNSSHVAISYAVFCLKKKLDDEFHETLSNFIQSNYLIIRRLIEYLSSN